MRVGLRKEEICKERDERRTISDGARCEGRRERDERWAERRKERGRGEKRGERGERRREREERRCTGEGDCNRKRKTAAHAIFLSPFIANKSFTSVHMLVKKWRKSNCNPTKQIEQITRGSEHHYQSMHI